MHPTIVRISKKTREEIADRFESALDYCPALDRLPFHIKREVAEIAARIAVEKIEES